MRSGKAHCDQELAEELRRGDEEGEAAQLTENLTTLTWQVGIKDLKAQGFLARLGGRRLVFSVRLL